VQEIRAARSGGFHTFQIEKYIAKILNNFAKDLGAKITTSIPLGHLESYEHFHTPNRFIEQIQAFEYLFYKSMPEKKDITTLKEKLETMFNFFPDVLNHINMSADDVAKNIKKLRVNIVHGDSYYYDFKDDNISQRYIFTCELEVHQ
jgi:hypothetical protein